ncbi:MAG: NMD3-related protein [Candidatus Micrarchaeota archaeon]|nr:NMD3-related protein [Candidatus Micrarchaeota archaeon]
MDLHCPSCGGVKDSGEFIRNFCKECFAAHFALAQIPPVIDIGRCAVCSRNRHGDQWVEENKRVLTAIMTGKVKSPYSPVVTDVQLREGRNLFDAVLTIQYTVDGVKIERRVSIRLKFDQIQCVDCSRESGGYFDTVVQFRLLEEVERKQLVEEMEKLEPKVKKFVKQLTAHGGRVHKLERTETGFDIHAAGITPAMQTSHAICRKVKHTRKLVGRKNGKDLYRHTFCLRF